MRLILSVLADDDGLADAEIAEVLGETAASVRQALRIMYRRRQVDLVLGYACLPARPGEGRRAA